MLEVRKRLMIACLCLLFGSVEVLVLILSASRSH